MWVGSSVATTPGSISVTHEATKTAVDRLYQQAPVTAEDIAEVIAFAVSRPRHLAIHEILLRPADQV